MKKNKHQISILSLPPVCQICGELWSDHDKECEGDIHQFKVEKSIYTLNYACQCKKVRCNIKSTIDQKFAIDLSQLEIKANHA